jgi:hypothetical protein
MAEIMNRLLVAMGDGKIAWGRSYSRHRADPSRRTGDQRASLHGDASVPVALRRTGRAHPAPMWSSATTTAEREKGTDDADLPRT